jgi:hypothetical protein
MELNSKILKVSGKIELDPKKELQNGQVIIIRAEGQIVKVEEGDNQDGTFDKTYKLKLSIADIQ